MTQISFGVCRGVPKRWQRPYALVGLVNREAFAAPALGTDIRILKNKQLSQFLFLKVNGCSIDQSKALRIDENIDTAAMKHVIILIDLSCYINDISKAGATGFSHAEPESLSRGSIHIGSNSICSRFCQVDGHSYAGFPIVSVSIDKLKWYRFQVLMILHQAADTN